MAEQQEVVGVVVLLQRLLNRFAQRSEGRLPEFLLAARLPQEHQPHEVVGRLAARTVQLELHLHAVPHGFFVEEGESLGPFVLEDALGRVPDRTDAFLALVHAVYWSVEEPGVELVGGHRGAHLGLELLELPLLPHEVPLQLHALLGAGELEGEGEEGVEGDGEFVAVGAPDLRSVLSGERVGDEGVVALLEVVPAEGADQFVGTAVALYFLGGGLGADAVEVLMEFVEEVVEELLAVLVVVPPELRVPLHYSQHLHRLQRTPAAAVEGLGQLAVRAGQVALAAQHVAHVEVFQM